MNVKRTATSPLVIIALIVVSVSSTWLLDHFNFFSRIELASFDHRVLMFRADKKIHDDVVVLVIDEESLQNMANDFGRWPWPRAAYSDLLEFFTLAQAQSLAFDILFTEQESSGEMNASDRQLINATKKSALAVHAMQLLNLSEKGSGKVMPEQFIRQHQIENIDFSGESYNDFLIPMDGLYQASRDVANLEIEPDRDGVYRRVRLFNQYNEKAVFPSLSTALVMPLIYDGSQLVNNANRAKIGSIEVPLDGSGQFLMNPYGKLNILPVYKVFAAMKQIHSGQKTKLIVDPADYAHKTILLGASAIGLLDVKATAIASKQAGVFMHAYTVSNILQQDFLISNSQLFSYILITLFAIITVSSVLLLSRISLAALIAFCIAVFYIVIAYISFEDNQVYSIMPVIFSIVFSLLLSFSYRSYSEKYGKQKVRAMLSQYVSPTVLTNVIDNYDSLTAEVGSNETLTILFSDIRGFTQISENEPAPNVVDMLNIYFSEMTDIIFEHDGTLDKFIGDAIMAFWGAPVKTQNHADQAVLAAISMREKLGSVNKKLADKGYSQIEIGIGLHTGRVVLGNIGSAKKLDYTVIGDSVNIASRIEGITKQYGVSLILSEDTYNELSDIIPCIVVDEVQLKGKQQPVKLFTPAKNFKNENNITLSLAELINLSNKAFSLYQQKRWDEAMTIYHQFKDCRLFDLMSDRCIGYMNNEPDNDWNGVFIHTTK